jgi:HK97 family phage prohead protease
MANLTATLEIKSLDANGRFAGYASVFDVIDSQRDMVLRGAFKNSLAVRLGQIKLLWQHQWEEPIGVLMKIFEDEKGLYVEGLLLMEVARAREAYALLKAGAVNGLSIGYTPGRWLRDPDSGVRKLQSIDLWEISLVTMPANPAAKVTVVKGNLVDFEEAQTIRSGAMMQLADAIDRALISLK